MFYGGGLSYVASVTGLFYLLCERADALSKAVSEAIDHLFICLILGISKLDLLVSWEQIGCSFWNHCISLIHLSDVFPITSESFPHSMAW